jgi:hypothetical protein
MITTDPQARKAAPLYTGCFAYFPKAITMLAQYDWVDDEYSRPAAECLAALLAGESIPPEFVQDRALSIATCALDLLQEEITGESMAGSWSPDGVHSIMVRYAEAWLDVAALSRVGSDQHNPGKPLFWDRSKSGDELDALARHLVQAGTLDTDGVRHSTKVCWRALANLEKAIEREEEVHAQAERLRTPGPGFRGVLGTVMSVDPGTREATVAVGHGQGKASLASACARECARAVEYRYPVGKAFYSVTFDIKFTPPPKPKPKTPKELAAEDPDVVWNEAHGAQRMVGCQRGYVLVEGGSWPLKPDHWVHSRDQHPKLLAFHKRKYKLAPGEYRDPESGLIKDLAEDEVRFADGSVHKLTMFHGERVFIGDTTGLYWDPYKSCLASAGNVLPGSQLYRVVAFYSANATATP